MSPAETNASTNSAITPSFVDEVSSERIALGDMKTENFIVSST
jgi:hypothetical protein